MGISAHKMAFLSPKKILHRDISPKNLLFKAAMSSEKNDEDVGSAETVLEQCDNQGDIAQEREKHTIDSQDVRDGMLIDFDYAVCFADDNPIAIGERTVSVHCFCFPRGSWSSYVCREQCHSWPPAF